MKPDEAWVTSRNEILRRIKAELAGKPESQRSVWYIEESDGDMSEFATMLGVIDRILAAEPLDWPKAIKYAERGSECAEKSQ